MSNETLARNIMEVLSEHGVYPDAEDDAFELRLAIRREIDGNLAAQAERGENAWEAIVEQCVVTEAVKPDESDPYGTISKLIDYHVANTAPPSAAGVPDALPEVQVCQTYMGEPVSPEQVAYHEGWNECRAAVLSAIPSPTIGDAK